ncbi:hypothetical protein ABIA45_007369 [Bradyrhizobium sp. USDA 336]
MMVTVVDAANLLKDYASHDLLRDRGETREPGDERALVDLLFNSRQDLRGEWNTSHTFG